MGCGARDSDAEEEQRHARREHCGVQDEVRGSTGSPTVSGVMAITGHMVAETGVASPTPASLSPLRAWARGAAPPSTTGRMPHAVA